MSTAQRDEELLIRVAGGDRNAFAEFLSQHLASMVSFAYRYTSNRQDAEDVAQEAFLRVWLKASQWQPGQASPMAWVYRITYHLCVDHLRRQRLHAVEMVDSLAAGVQDEPEQQFEQSRQQQAIRSALAGLPERQYTALALCAFQGLSNREAASILDISVDALESLLSRARRTLKQTLLSPDDSTTS